MKVQWLSYPLSVEAPRPPAIPEPSVTEFMSIAETGANVQFLQCYNHTGSHLDTAVHVFEDGISINAFNPEDLIYENIKVIDLTGTPDDTVITPEILKPYLDDGSDAEALIVKFSVEDYRKNQKERFSKHCPGFCQDAAVYVHEKMPNLRLIGTDIPSIACIAYLDDTMTAHNVFFSEAKLEKFIIIEEMKLDVELEGLKKMIVSPWMVSGMNSGPCVIWGEWN